MTYIMLHKFYDGGCDNQARYFGQPCDTKAEAYEWLLANWRRKSECGIMCLEEDNMHERWCVMSSRTGEILEEFYIQAVAF